MVDWRIDREFVLEDIIQLMYFKGVFKNKNMEDEPKNLEKKAWYRILKILYGMGWITVFIVTGLAFFILKPTGYIDLYKSTVTCPDGNKYQLNSLKGFYKVGQNFNTEDQLIVQKICKVEPTVTIRNSQTGEMKQVPQSQLAQYGLQAPQGQAPQPQPQQTGISKNLEEQGSWGQALLWTTVVLYASIFLLNLIKGVVLYITTGKKFSLWYPVSNKDQGK